MRPTLFRQHAVDAARERPLGSIALIRPLSAAWITAGAVLTALAVVAFACWGQYTRKATVTGYLSPTKGIIKVLASSTGTVVSRHVREGQRVNRGDTLFVLSTDQRSLSAPEVQAAAMATLHQRRDSLTHELEQHARLSGIEHHSLEERIAGMRQESIQLQAQMATQQARIRNAQSTVERHQKLLAQHFLSEAVVQQKQDDLLDQQGRLQVLQRSMVTLKRDLGALELDLNASGLKADTRRQAIEREIAQIDQQLTESEARRAVVIAAPADGVVTTVLAEEGQSATPTTPLLSILPAGAKLQAELLVPSRSIGFIAPAQQVALRYQPFPYQRFGWYEGRVSEISKTLISPGDATLPVPLREPAYRVTVTIDAQSVHAYGKEVPLQAGMSLEADVALDHRRLIEWIFDPLYSLTRRA